ncbi:hypothetical protein Tco_1310898 [Tanacetum coccineum]
MLKTSTIMWSESIEFRNQSRTQPNTGKQEKKRQTCGYYRKYEESHVKIKCGSISKKKKSNYSSFQDLRSSCNRDMVKYKGPRPSTTQARALNEKSNKKIPLATSQPPGRRVYPPAEGVPPGRRPCRPSLEPTGKTYNPPANPNTKTTVFLDDTEEEAAEVKKEAEPVPKKPTQTDTPPLKAYNLKIPYPQCFNKEKMEARYAKFLDMIKEVRINVPLVDVLAGMPNYGKFLKDLYPMGVAENMLVQVGKFVFLVDFVILQMEEDDRVPFILGRPFLHTADANIRHSYVNDDTCFRMDVIDEITEDELDALLDDSKPFLNTSEKISETPLDKEFNEFMSGNVQEDEVKDDFEELPPKDELRIRTSIQDPPTDLEMKPLPKHLEYSFLEENSFLPVVISALLEQNEKERLVSVLKNHKEAFAWKTSDILRISPSFCKHKINFEDDVKLVIQRQR